MFNEDLSSLHFPKITKQLGTRTGEVDGSFSSFRKHATNRWNTRLPRVSVNYALFSGNDQACNKSYRHTGAEGFFVHLPRPPIEPPLLSMRFCRGKNARRCLHKYPPRTNEVFFARTSNSVLPCVVLDTVVSPVAINALYLYRPVPPLTIEANPAH